MNKILNLFFIASLVIIISSCAENQTRIGEGAGIGGGLGALAGGIIGHQTHSTVAGVLIGGAAGAATGALVGSQIPKQPQYTNYPPVPINQISMDQIVQWTRQGTPSEEIISRIRSTSSRYSLTAEDIDYLERHGVSQRVIDFMSATKTRP